jgi:hypothetical protein
VFHATLAVINEALITGSTDRDLYKMVLDNAKEIVVFFTWFQPRYQIVDMILGWELELLVRGW